MGAPRAPARSAASSRADGGQESWIRLGHQCTARVQQYLHACSSSRLVWVETVASPPAADVANPPVLCAVVSLMRGP